ncbi:hypothetical protein ES705_13526 [subsurface metagenome]
MSGFKIAQSYYEPDVKGIFGILKSQEYGRTYASYLQKKLKNDETYRRICKAIRPVNHYYFVMKKHENNSLLLSFNPFGSKTIRSTQ